MSAFGEFKVITSDTAEYVEGWTYDIVLNSDHSYNQYDGTANAKAALVAEVSPVADAPSPDLPSEDVPPTQTVA